MRHLTIAFAALLAAATLNGCLSMEQRLRGRWESDMGMGYIEFRSDKTFTWNMMMVQEGTWRVLDDTLLITSRSMSFDDSALKEMGAADNSEPPPDMGSFTDQMPPVEMALTYKLKGDELTIRMAGMSMHYTKAR